MEFKENLSLKSYNTFGIDAKAKYFIEIFQENQLFELTKIYNLKKDNFFILGGGSNVLFKGDYDGLIIKISLKGKNKIEEANENVIYEVSAGEDWDEWVDFTVKNNYFGLENLSLIPGVVGSCPVQNIGAYGVEVKDTIQYVNAFNLNTLKIEKIFNHQCGFGYRDSNFKTIWKGQYVILSVAFNLKKIGKINIEYGAIEKELNKMGVSSYTLSNVREAICNIRNSKLPKPEQIGNAGSFFKNPTISIAQFEELKSKYIDIQSYPIDDKLIKLPAGWLIEKCGWKGKRIGECGVHEHQSLVLVNYGSAKGSDIINLSEKIIQSVYETFNIKISAEVNIV